MRVAFVSPKPGHDSAIATSGVNGILLVKGMTFASLVPSHMYACLHQHGRMCHLCLVGARQRCVQSHCLGHVGELLTLPRRHLARISSSLVGTRRIDNCECTAIGDMLAWTMLAT
uniref:Uncharacterized protein n=1 Tax=Arundo donax TaxID=35708 RepID=A0A0A8XRP1_ARUDO